MRFSQPGFSLDKNEEKKCYLTFRQNQNSGIFFKIPN